MSIGLPDVSMRYGWVLDLSGVAVADAILLGEMHRSFAAFGYRRTALSMTT